MACKIWIRPLGRLRGREVFRPANEPAGRFARDVESMFQNENKTSMYPAKKQGYWRVGQDLKAMKAGTTNQEQLRSQILSWMQAYRATANGVTELPVFVDEVYQSVELYIRFPELTAREGGESTITGAEWDAKVAEIRQKHPEAAEIWNMCRLAELGAVQKDVFGAITVSQMQQEIVNVKAELNQLKTGPGGFARGGLGMMGVGGFTGVASGQHGTGGAYGAASVVTARLHGVRMPAVTIDYGDSDNMSKQAESTRIFCDYKCLNGIRADGTLGRYFVCGADPVHKDI
ncbi:hypothetical protein HK097_003825, partial [Rhizophlyctis rosea]